MKKLLISLSVIVIIATFAIIIGITVCSCGEDNKNPDGSLKVRYSDKGNYGSTPLVIVIDSCEYISWGYGLTHKGNCKFCEERRRKEYEAFLEDIIIELY